MPPPSILPDCMHPASLQFHLVPPDTAATHLDDPQVLAVLGFGRPEPGAEVDDARRLWVPLQPHGPARLEIWRGATPVAHGHDGDVRWAENGHLQFGAIEVDEAGIGIQAATAHAYRRIAAIQASRGYPHALRIWNYMDAILQGNGDEERYRHFCVGRVAGMSALHEPALPAATCIGSVDGPRRLQVYWLAGRVPGTPLENPRQISAYRYPRQYGPQSPSFARAMLSATGDGLPLLLSGTASIVGHRSMHAGDMVAQLDEILANLQALREAAHARSVAVPTLHAPGSTLLKVYVSDSTRLDEAHALLARRLGDRVPYLLLHGEVCRPGLDLEIEGVLGLSP